MKTVAFYSNQLCLRGTEIAMYNYADYNEKILGNKSIIFSMKGANMDAYEKFSDRFPVHLLSGFHAPTIENICEKNNVDFFYAIKAGNQDGIMLNNIPTLVHVVFRCNDPHGHKYAYVSDWLAKDQGYNPETHSVPHICEPFPNSSIDLREELNIPKTATVFGRYGGETEFNVHDAHRAVEEVAKNNKDVYFLFMKTNKFCDDHERIIHVPSTYDLERKAAFVRASDAMLHARQYGETFGLAIAEFSLENKPILTLYNPEANPEANHFEVLGDKALKWRGFEDLSDMLNNLPSYIRYEDYNCYRHFNPTSVMEKFNKVFLS